MVVSRDWKNLCAKKCHEMGLELGGTPGSEGNGGVCILKDTSLPSWPCWPYMCHCYPTLKCCFCVALSSFVVFSRALPLPNYCCGGFRKVRPRSRKAAPQLRMLSKCWCKDE
jgi:hypothetical protein